MVKRRAAERSSQRVGRAPTEDAGLEAVLDATRQLLGITTPAEAADVARNLITALGGQIVPAAGAPSSQALPLDVSFGQGMPLVPLAPPLSVARLLLERHLPSFILDAQQALAQAQKARALADQASALAELPDPLFIMKAVRDPDGTVVELVFAFLNEAAARLYGMRVDEVLGYGQCELFPSVREVGIWDTYLGVIGSGSPASLDVPYFNERGVEGSFRLTAVKFGDGLLISANDITEQVRAEQERDADQAALRATVDSLLDPVIRLGAERDESGEIVDFVFEDANPAACEYNKMTYEQLIGARLLDLLPGHLGMGLFEMYRRVIEADEPLVLDDFVYPQELLGGAERHYDIRAAHVAGDWMTYTWRDVTERQSQREIAERQDRDRQRLEELERFQRITVGRELKMIELKKEIEDLKRDGHGD